MRRNRDAAATRIQFIDNTLALNQWPLSLARFWRATRLRPDRGPHGELRFANMEINGAMLAPDAVSPIGI